MKNERQIKPLREYRLSWLVDYELPAEVFTADTYVQDDNSLIFLNTGNVVRQYFYPLPFKIEVTPVDEAEVPK